MNKTWKKILCVALVVIVIAAIAVVLGLPFKKNKKSDCDCNCECQNNLKDILWSKNYKTISKKSLPSDYYSAPTEKIFSKNYLESNIKNTGVIWLRNGSDCNNNDVTSFINHIVNMDSFEKKKFILITTDGDNSVPSSVCQTIGKKALLDFLDSKYLINWYMQNYDGSIVHSKLNPIPIGFDLHTLFDNSIEKGNKGFCEMLKIRKANSFNERVFSALIDEMTLSHPERNDVLKKIETFDNSKFFVKKEKLSRAELFKNYCKYTFGLSPRGNGIDCHRTWEMLFFGMIPIIKKSSVDSLYLNLPVLLVDSYNDLEKINYLEKYNELKIFLPISKKKFTINFWLNNLNL
jgi:hypothetical protein